MATSKKSSKDKRKLTGAAADMYEWLEAVAFALAIVVVLFTFVFRVIRIEGDSMLDTLHEEDRLIVQNLFYEPENNDIVVVVQDNSHTTEPIIKRVIAIAGQTVELDPTTGAVTVDGIKIDEPYISPDKIMTNAGDSFTYPVKVPEGKIFVLGDNRPVSFDSRDARLGFVDLDNVLGKALLRIYPVADFGGIYE
ncbi:MAG: signal peptidase I [Oscillospiraceae bacterium]|jgi:signal peptidase I|nr:signal peptidase I [Oscillospiraceae bacterium]